MSATGDPSDGQSGTTLIEALAVVTITALVSLIAFPRMQQTFLTLALRQTATSIAAGLREARADALTHDRSVVFAVAADGQAYQANDRRPGRTPPGVRLATDDAPQGRIAFYGDGSSSGGVVWVKADTRAIGISVKPLSGAVAMLR